MEIKTMTIDELNDRMAEIASEIDSLEDMETINARSAEYEEIKAELEARKAAEAKKAEIRAAVANGQGEVVQKIEPEERKKPTMEEIRNSKAYIDAYANYIKTENDAECRALLTENGTNGTVPVPEFVYDVVKTAWDREGITSRVRKAYLKGNLKVGFEISGQDAIVHTEGGAAIDPENLVLGTVELIPKSIKKVVQISDEVYDMRGEEFLRYIYEELTYRIAKKAADELIAKIKACGTVSTTTCPGVPQITVTTASMGTIAQAISNLSDEAANPVIMMNKLTWSAFKEVQYANGYGADPFEGLPVVFNDTIAAFSAATTGVTYAIVGDLGVGAQANFPNGQQIEIKFDDKTKMEYDLIRILGREYVGHAVVAPKAFAKICH